VHFRVVLLIGLVFVAAALPVHRDSKTVENADERVSLTDETNDLNGGANDASVADASAVDASPVDGEEDVQVEQGVKRRRRSSESSRRRRSSGSSRRRRSSGSSRRRRSSGSYHSAAGLMQASPYLTALVSLVVSLYLAQ